MKCSTVTDTLSVLWLNGWMDQDGSWHGTGPWSRPDCARWGPSSPPQKGTEPPQFSAHFYCDETAGCIKMPLGMELRPHLTQSHLGRGLPTIQVASLSIWTIQPFGHNRKGRKLGGGCAPFLWRGAGSPSNTMSPGQMPTSVPSGILIHPAVWPQ